MDTTSLPSLFVSHSSPMLAIQDSATGRFFDHLGAALPRPRAVIVASAHCNAPDPVVIATPEPATVHDFGGFPPTLYQIEYPVHGAPVLAAQVVRRLTEAGFEGTRADSQAGIDHGVWVPLRRMYPQADIPVVVVSVSPGRSAEWHYALGRTLAPLRAEGVLVIGSGGFSHNLRELDWRQGDVPARQWMTVFTDALREKLLTADIAGALDWRTLPEAQRNHPTPEHLYPLYVALGAAGEDAKATALHRAVEMGALALDAFSFEGRLPA